MMILKLTCSDRGSPVVLWVENPDGSVRKLASMSATHAQEMTVELNAGVEGDVFDEDTGEADE